MNMEVMLDGKKPKIVGNDVKIIWDDVETTVSDLEIKGKLHLTATHEGIILDFVDGNGEVFITQSIYLNDLFKIMDEIKTLHLS
jgi:hypothetical protein